MNAAWAAKHGLDPADVEEKFVRGAGPGGQKINKTSSTVWLRHRPTGIEVRCQEERSQSANRERAWQLLAAKIAERREAARAMSEQEREAERRRTRQKSARQKSRMVQAKRFHARHKANRGRVAED
jgi:protein subunit release factor B